jgi:hypothetical protein
MFWAATFHHHPFLVPLFQHFMTSSDEQKMRPHGLQVSYCATETDSHSAAQHQTDYHSAVQHQTLLQALKVFNAANTVHI